MYNNPPPFYEWIFISSPFFKKVDYYIPTTYFDDLKLFPFVVYYIRSFPQPQVKNLALYTTYCILAPYLGCYFYAFF